MSYRFTNTDKWDDEWFFELKPCEKLVWFYILDKCDNAGFYEMPMRKACFELGIDEEKYLGAIEGLNRGYIGSSKEGKLWVKNFLRHQKNGKLNPDNNAHKQIISLINSKHKDYAGLIDNLGSNQPLFRGTGKGKGKGKGKVMVMDNYMITIGSWFNRKPETKWSKNEFDKYNDNKDLIQETIDEMESYYTSDCEYKRKDVQTLLNNWTGELDRARDFKSQKNGEITF